MHERLSPRGVATVDGKCDADDEARGGAAEPQHRCGDFFGFTESVDGLGGDRLGEVEWALIGVPPSRPTFPIGNVGGEPWLGRRCNPSPSRFVSAPKGEIYDD